MTVDPQRVVGEGGLVTIATMVVSFYAMLFGSSVAPGVETGGVIALILSPLILVLYTFRAAHEAAVQEVAAR